MNLKEKALSPPPKPDLAFPELQQAKLSKFFSYMQDTYRWMLRMVDVIPKIQTTDLAINPGNVGANTTSEQDFTVSGLRPTDIVYVNKPSETAGLGVVNARCKANDVVSITFMNTTAGIIDPPAETYTLVAIRR